MGFLSHLLLNVRQLSNAGRYTLSCILTFALAIGANTAIFSSIYTVLLAPGPIISPNELVLLWEANRSRGLEVVEVTFRMYEHLAAHSRSLTHLAAMGSSTWPVTLEGRAEPIRCSSSGVSASFFDTLGATPFLGRTFRPDDDVPNASRVVVLSYSSWQRHFGGDPQAIGATLLFGEVPHTVIGVMPEGLDFPQGVDFWTPVLPILFDASNPQMDAREQVGVLYVLGRMRPGVSRRIVAAETRLLAERYSHVASRLGSDVVVTPFLDYLFGPVHHGLWALWAAVVVLLLIACANVSGFMLTRVSHRRREHAIRLALGARPASLGYLWAGEAALLAVAGGLAGLPASWAIARLLVSIAPDNIPGLSRMTYNLPVAIVTFVIVALATFLSGVGPVREAASTNLLGSLSDGARQTTARRIHAIRSVLLVTQIGLAVVLLTAATVILRTVHRLHRVELGFRAAGVLVMEIQPRGEQSSPNEWFETLFTHLTALPQIEAAGAVSLRPLAFGPIGQETLVLLDGQADTPAARQQNPVLNYQIATPGYFGAMRIELKRGRLFTSQDNSRTPRVALVSESAARRLWPGQDPIGKRLLAPTFAADGPAEAWRSVIGVVSDVHYRALDDVRLDVYDAALQADGIASDLVVRTTGDPLALVPIIKAVARQLDSRVIVERITTMDAIVSRARAPWHLAMWMFTMFAIVALLLAIIGLYSLVSLHVSYRYREFAIHLALGATGNDIVRSVLAFAGWRILPGVGFGLIVAIPINHITQSMLFHVEVLDSVTYAVVLAPISLAVAIASYLPARRAASLDPARLLKQE